MSERRGEEALHRRIRGDIEARIVSGEWPPGTRVPFEMELAAQYNCSRMTVNKAMTDLARAGLIERRKKSGSFVLQPKFHSAVLEVHDIMREVQSLNVAHSHVIARRAVRKASAADRARLGLGAATKILEVVTLHRAGRMPFCLEDRLINLAAVPEAEAETFAEMAPGTWLIAKVPWSEAEHRIHAVAADAAEARLLEIAPGTACLVVDRRTFGASGPVTQVRTVYPGDRHALTARFTPSTSGSI